MIKKVKNREKEKFLYEIEETIQGIEDQGRSINQRKEQQVWFIDEDLAKLLKLHKDLDKDKPYLQGRPSEERCVILDEEVKLLWKKIVAYVYYGNSERNPRNNAVEALNKVKTQI